MSFFYINDICSLTISYIHAYNVFRLNSCLFVLVCILLCDPLSLTSFAWVSTGFEQSIRAWWADEEEHSGDKDSSSSRIRQQLVAQQGGQVLRRASPAQVHICCELLMAVSVF